MRDVELNQQLLGVVSPWTLNRVELSVEAKRVDVWVKHAPEVIGPAVSTKHPAESLEAQPDCERNLPRTEHTRHMRQPTPSTLLPRCLSPKFERIDFPIRYFGEGYSESLATPNYNSTSQSFLQLKYELLRNRP